MDYTAVSSNVQAETLSPVDFNEESVTNLGRDRPHVEPMLGGDSHSYDNLIESWINEDKTTKNPHNLYAAMNILRICEPFTLSFTKLREHFFELEEANPNPFHILKGILELLKLDFDISMSEVATTGKHLSNLLGKLSPDEILYKQGLTNIEEEREFLNSLLGKHFDRTGASKVTGEQLSEMEFDLLNSLLRNKANLFSKKAVNSPSTGQTEPKSRGNMEGEQGEGVLFGGLLPNRAQATPNPAPTLIPQTARLAPPPGFSTGGIQTGVREFSSQDQNPVTPVSLGGNLGDFSGSFLPPRIENEVVLEPGSTQPYSVQIGPTNRFVPVPNSTLFRLEAFASAPRQETHQPRTQNLLNQFNNPMFSPENQTAWNEVSSPGRNEFPQSAQFNNVGRNEFLPQRQTEIPQSAHLNAAARDEYLPQGQADTPQSAHSDAFARNELLPKRQDVVPQPVSFRPMPHSERIPPRQFETPHTRQVLFPRNTSPDGTNFYLRPTPLNPRTFDLSNAPDIPEWEQLIIEADKQKEMVCGKKCIDLIYNIAALYRNKEMQADVKNKLTGTSAKELESIYTKRKHAVDQAINKFVLDHREKGPVYLKQFRDICGREPGLDDVSSILGALCDMKDRGPSAPKSDLDTESFVEPHASQWKIGHQAYRPNGDRVEIQLIVGTMASVKFMRKSQQVNLADLTLFRTAYPAPKIWAKHEDLLLFNTISEFESLKSSTNSECSLDNFVQDPPRSSSITDGYRFLNRVGQLYFDMRRVKDTRLTPDSALISAYKRVYENLQRKSAEMHKILKCFSLALEANKPMALVLEALECALIGGAHISTLRSAFDNKSQDPNVESASQFAEDMITLVSDLDNFIGEKECFFVIANKLTPCVLQRKLLRELDSGLEGVSKFLEFIRDRERRGEGYSAALTEQVFLAQPASGVPMTPVHPQATTDVGREGVPQKRERNVYEQPYVPPAQNSRTNSEDNGGKPTRQQGNQYAPNSLGRGYRGFGGRTNSNFRGGGFRGRFQGNRGRGGNQFGVTIPKQCDVGDYAAKRQVSWLQGLFGKDSYATNALRFDKRRIEVCYVCGAFCRTLDCNHNFNVTHCSACNFKHQPEGQCPFIKGKIKLFQDWEMKELSEGLNAKKQRVA